jgi:hypothetical protein
MRKPTQTDYIKTALRLPPRLHSQVHEAAKGAGRTYNAELIDRIQASFDDTIHPMTGLSHDPYKRGFADGLLYAFDALAGKQLDRAAFEECYRRFKTYADTGVAPELNNPVFPINLALPMPAPFEALGEEPRDKKGRRPNAPKK